MFAVTLLAISHNGVVHEPGASSSVLIGPSDIHGYVTFNYGRNWVERHPEWNNLHFPVAVHERADRTLFAVADTGDAFEYFVNGAVQAVPSCPVPEKSKISRWGDIVYMFGLETGTVTELVVGGCRNTTFSWPSPSWTPLWGGDHYSDNPLFYDAHFYKGCMWYVTRRNNVRIETRGCTVDYVSPRLNDGCSYNEKDCGVHEGGAFVVHNDVLYWVNGETGTVEYEAVQGADKYAGKLLRIDAPHAPIIVGSGFRHPWTAVAVQGGVAVADVGGGEAEEVTIFAPRQGQNFGWPIVEGDLTRRPLGARPAFTNFVMPSAVYHHSTNRDEAGPQMWAAVSVWLGAAAAAGIRFWKHPVTAGTVTLAIAAGFAAAPVWFSARGYLSGYGPYGGLYIDDPPLAFEVVAPMAVAIAIVAVLLIWAPLRLFAALFLVVTLAWCIAAQMAPYDPTATAVAALSFGVIALIVNGIEVRKPPQEIVATFPF